MSICLRVKVFDDIADVSLLQLAKFINISVSYIYSLFFWATVNLFFESKACLSKGWLISR